MRSQFTSGGSSIKAAHKLEALYRAIIKLSNIEDKANRDNPAAQTANVSWTITGDATKSFSATVLFPARMVEVDGDEQLVPRNLYADYIEWEAGTEDLAGTVSLADALIKIAKKITFLERQINPNIVIQTPNQISLIPSLEDGNYQLTVNLPLDIVEDEATGAIDYVIFNFLKVLDDQDAATAPIPAPVDP
jgi:hypothetical protein